MGRNERGLRVKLLAQKGLAATLPLMTIVIDCFGCHFSFMLLFLSVAYTALAVKNK
jgi:hypothetical protein